MRTVSQSRYIFQAAGGKLEILQPKPNMSETQLEMQRLGLDSPIDVCVQVLGHAGARTGDFQLIVLTL